MSQNKVANEKRIDKKESFASNTALLVRFLKGSKRYFVCCIISAIILSFFALVNPRIIGITVDSIVGNAEFDLPAFVVKFINSLGGRDFLRANLWVVTIAVIGFALLEGVFRISYKMSNAIGSETLVENIRNSLYKHIIRLPFEWHGQNATGDIIQRCTSDVETIKSFLSEQLVTLFRLVVLIALAVIYMLRIHVGLTMVVIVFIPITVAQSLYFHKKIAAAFEKTDAEEGKLSSIAQENLTGVRVVRAFGREEYERRRFEKQSEAYANSDLGLVRIFLAFFSFGSLISRLQIFLIILLGVWFCSKGSITGGQYIEYISYVIMISWPIRRLGRIISQMSKTSVSIDRLRYIMNSAEEEDEEGALIVPVNEDIEFKNISFEYVKGEKILDDVSFKIKAGSTVGILGGTGSGKSTLMYLLERLYDLQDDTKGEITIGNVPVNRIKRRHIRKRIGMVLQEPYLFSKTLAENISISNDKRELEDIRRAAGIASLDKTIESFTDGYDTFVGERGVTLSGGQKQRTAIAQTLIKKPDVLIFDDSLSAVDTETDERIRRALNKETQDQTVILIAHRITTLMHADNIIVLDRGRVVEEGTHKELINKDGIYKKIYELQLQNEA